MKPLRARCVSFGWTGFLLVLGILAVAFFPARGFGQDVVINEVMAANSTTIANPDGGNDFPDWIELYNTTGVQADIGGRWIREIEDKGFGGTPQNPDTKTNTFRIPAGTMLGPYGRILIWCDDKTNSPGYHTGWGLPQTGTALDILTNTGARITGAGVSFGFQITDLSLGRVPDGASMWQLNIPTPRTNNQAYPLVDLPLTVDRTNIFINEWCATNAPPNTNDWVEIYNASTNPVLVTGLVLGDSLAHNATNKYKAITNYSYLAGEDFLDFACDDKLKPGDHLNFQLSSSNGDTVTLYYGPPLSGTNVHATGFNFSISRTTKVDRISFPGNGTNPGYWTGHNSYGRLPDGGPIYNQPFLSPTRDDSNFQLMTNILVNEVLTHTDPPYEDAIELFNTTEAPVNIGGWWISNARNTPKKFRVPDGISILARGHFVFYEMVGRSNEFPRPGFNTHNQTLPEDFILNSAHGDEVWIFDARPYSEDPEGALLGTRGSMQFDAAENGVSFGPFISSIGDREIVPLVRPTFGISNPSSVEEFRFGTGATNAPPRVNPVVISEVYYHPPDIIIQGTNIDNDFDEFVEIYNAGMTNALMYDPNFYNLGDGIFADGRTNTWRLRGVVQQRFPTNVVLAPGQFVLFVNFNPTNTTQLNDFRNRLNVPEHIQIFGAYDDKLDNRKGDVELKRPDPPQSDTNELGFVPLILVDSLDYEDTYLTLADGRTNNVNGTSTWPHIGYSLNRLVPENYPAFPDNWETKPPSPGRQPVKIDSVTRSGNSVAIRFRGWAASSYTVQASAALEGSPWFKVADVPAQATSGVRQVIDPNASTNASWFYRVAHPMQP